MHTSDVDGLRFLCADNIIELVESRVWAEMDTMDSIALSTCDACYTIQLFCHTLSPL